VEDGRLQGIADNLRYAQRMDECNKKHYKPSLLLCCTYQLQRSVQK